MNSTSQSKETDPGLSLSDVCVEVIDEVAQRLEEEELHGNEELVHLVRVMTKRLRAAWQMAKGIAPSEKVKERRTALRELSARLSGYRDEAVLKNLCDQLSEGKSADEQQALQSVGGGISTTDDCGDMISPDELAGRLEEERQEWLALDWSEREECDKIIREGVEKSYRKARKTTKRARKTVCSETWHDWRKSIKQLRYQREFLARLEDRPLTEFEIAVRDLGSLLGQRNDLANLEAYAKKGSAVSSSNRHVLDAAIDESTSRLMKKCCRAGKALFRDKKSG